MPRAAMWQAAAVAGPKSLGWRVGGPGIQHCCRWAQAPRRRGGGPAPEPSSPPPPLLLLLLARTPKAALPGAGSRVAGAGSRDAARRRARRVGGGGGGGRGQSGVRHALWWIPSCSCGGRAAEGASQRPSIGGTTKQNGEDRTCWLRVIVQPSALTNMLGGSKVETERGAGCERWEL